MLAVLPILLWIAAAVMALCVAALCVVRSGLCPGRRTGSPVGEVSQSVLRTHLATVVVAALIYPAYYLALGDMGPWWRRVYDMVGIPSAVVLVVLIVVQLGCMYMQARQVMLMQTRRQQRKDSGEDADPGSDDPA